MKLKTAIKTIYGHVNIYEDNEGLKKIGSIKSYTEWGYIVIKAHANDEEESESAIREVLDRQVKEIFATSLGDICIYLK